VRRIIGTLFAVALAIAGTLLLVGYVRGAEERALAGEELVPVVVADAPIEQGSGSEALATAVRIEQVPAKVRADDAVAELADLEGMAAAVDLMPGEQLLMSRFVEPETLETHRRVEVPPDLLEITVSLMPERAVGGRLEAGDLVAVFASFDPFEADAVEPGTEEPIGIGEPLDPESDGVILVGTTEGEEENRVRTPNSTHLVLHKILVTNVQVEQLPRRPDEDAGDEAPELAPTGNLLITLAALPGDAQRIVFTAEHGFLWLAAEDADADEPETVIENRATVYR
jgi:pilus assembly protein CpaB